MSLIESETGETVWETTDFKSSGIGALKYLPETYQLLIAGDMAGLKDIIKSASAEITMKQVYLIDAADGTIQWSAKFKGRDDELRKINSRDGKVHLYFDGGYAEIFNLEDGLPVFNTLAGNLVGLRKATSAAFGTGEGNVLATRETAEPIFEDNYVYAVNAVNTYTVGFPDKQLFKYDNESGEVMWESPILKHAPDVRDMTLTDELVIVRVSLNSPDDAMGKRGAVAGGVMDFGLYAFDRETGEAAWEVSEPFSKHISNAVFEDEMVWAAGGNTVYKIRLTNGEILQQKSFDTNTIFMLHELQNGELFVRGWQGFTVIGKDSLNVSYESGIAGRLMNYHLDNQFYTVITEKLLSDKQTIQVFDLIDQKELIEFTLEKPEQSVFGNLYDTGYQRLYSPEQLVSINQNGLMSYLLNK